jgi:alkylation response protein AidB-like acyl-CoA dehydrogenase
VVEQGNAGLLEPATPRTSTVFGLSNTVRPVPRRRRGAGAENLIGGVEGKGLVQAQQVFGYTRLMVAAFGLGGGWEALDRAITYSVERHPRRCPAVTEAGLHPQADHPAPAVRLEAARSVHRGDRRQASTSGEGDPRRAQHRGRDREADLATEAGNSRR